MRFVTTPAGEALLRNSANPPTLALFKLGYTPNYYVPNPNQADIVGTEVGRGTPSAPVSQSANLIKYVVVMEGITTNLEFNQVGLFTTDGLLFAIGTNNPAISIQGSANTPRRFAIDCYISIDEAEAHLYAQFSESQDSLNAQDVGSVDLLPRAVDARPNLILAPNPIDTNQSMLALSNNSIWSFSTHTEVAFSGQVETAATMWIRASDPAIAPSYQGELILQFVSGVNHGLCRVISSYSSATRTYQFGAALAELPSQGDSFIVLKATSLRPAVATLLSQLRPDLTAAQLNELVTTPLSSFIRKDGSVQMESHLSMGSFRIQNVANPVNPGDAANRGWVQSAIANAGLTGGGSSPGFQVEDYMSDSVPSTLSVFGSAGAANMLSRADHSHAHGDLPGGTLHALASLTAPGFMSPTDRQAITEFSARMNIVVRTFSVSNPSAVWTINHGMSTLNFAYFIFASSGEMEFAPVTLLNDDSFEIRFSVARAGRVVVLFDTNQPEVVN